MIQEFIRKHKETQQAFLVQYGKDEAGAFVPLKVQHTTPDDYTGNPKAASFKSCHIEATREGLYSIVTEFYLDQFTPTGVLSLSHCKVLRFVTKPAEAKTFIENLLPMVERNILNAYAAGNLEDGFLGHPNNRFFDAAGVSITSEDASAAEPTNDYNAEPDEPTPTA